MFKKAILLVLTFLSASTFAQNPTDTLADATTSKTDQEGREIDKDNSAGDQCGLPVFEDLSSIVVKIVNRGHVTNSYCLTVY